MNGKNIQSIYGISGKSKWTTGTDCHRELSDLSSNLSSAKNTSHQSGGPRWPISLRHNEARHDGPYGTAVVLRVQKLRLEVQKRRLGVRKRRLGVRKWQIGTRKRRRIWGGRGPFDEGFGALLTTDLANWRSHADVGNHGARSLDPRRT